MADGIKQIKEFPNQPEFGDEDLLLIQGEGITYNIQGSALKRYAEDAAKPQVELAAAEAQAAAKSAQDAAASADRSETATEHPPLIDYETGFWQVWDRASGSYVPTEFSALGKDFEIKGYYPSLNALESAVPAPGPGDAYGVGEEAPYDLYVWDAVAGEWRNNGPMAATGDMNKSVYDPQGKKQDIFAYAEEMGVPAGGSAGQVMMKSGAEDRAIAWADLPESSGVGKSLAGQEVEPTRGTTVTAGEGAEIFNDYRERTFSSDLYALTGNAASGLYSHAEGTCSAAMGDYSHAEGENTYSRGECSHAEGDYSFANGKASHAEGTMGRATGESSHAEGDYASASGKTSHAEGQSTSASGEGSHAEGKSTKASSDYSHAEGLNTTASGSESHAEGYGTTASGWWTHAAGYFTVAEYISETAVGAYNVQKNPGHANGDLFVVGKGSNGNARANAFRVSNEGVYGTSSFNASGADYAELFEWADGNPEGEDRAGRFVTLDGEKIRLAAPGDDYILGIVSAAPSVVGGVYDDQWAGMFLTDVYGRPLWEEVEVPAVTEDFPDPEDPEKTAAREIIPARTERRQRLNPDYDNKQRYIARSQRPEWAAVGLLGKLVANDDGTCRVNGWCAVGKDGGATASGERTRYRCMSRLDEGHVRIMIL